MNNTSSDAAQTSPPTRDTPMRAVQSVVIAAIVLMVSACSGHAIKSQPKTSSLPAQSAYTVPAASSATAVPSEQQHMPAVPDDVGGAPMQPADTAAQAEQDAQDLYGTPVIRDPWERFNRRMHGFNSVLDRAVLHPVAVGYDRVLPDPVQSGVSRFFGNLRLPATAINQALQGRPGHAGRSLGRFLVNSTVGIAGVFDPATRLGMTRPEGEDFGQTLASWGWRDSRYLVMPLLGPRTVRDTIAIVGDEPMSPLGYVDNAGVVDKLMALQMVEGRARLLPMDPIREDALDDYVFVRDAWAQRRQRQINQDLRARRAVRSLSRKQSAGAPFGP
ncbi:VacJ family lipoprotein [Stenotrophomonas sp. ISL-67]|uniref:MlaA family lipoprotein n=1 Tax=Stenotrophomonas sp. ISL-67 TaxID=2819171 RepID=UPI001BE94664|nr:VacJ family lipoprotein [Stenotrophomonas sp. ISL-67]MBT2766737.1 VacJ family lipoprotein [Stenotrophomonas sp. ISL-67]